MGKMPAVMPPGLRLTLLFKKSAAGVAGVVAVAAVTLS
jgi:hypothetical protein